MSEDEYQKCLARVEQDERNRIAQTHFLDAVKRIKSWHVDKAADPGPLPDSYFVRVNECYARSSDGVWQKVDQPDLLAQGAAQERARILKAIEKCKPTEQPYTRIQWRWEERGARAMRDKIMKAIEAAL